MKINHIHAEGVNGYIELDIEFNPMLNFLIGINGSGKTSTLKLILGLLTPSYDLLNQIEYNSVKIICSSIESERDIEISSSYIEANKYNLTVNIQTSITEAIFEKINYQTIESLQSENRSELIKRYSEEFFSLPPVAKIITLNTPVFLGLSRRFEQRRKEEYARRMAFRSRYYNFQKNDSIDGSLIEVQELIFDYHRHIAAQQPRITEEFKNKIFEKYFEFIDDIKSNRIESATNIGEKKRQVIEAVKNLNLSGFGSNISDFFDKIDGVREQYEQFNKSAKQPTSKEISIITKWFINSPQLSRIDSLLDLSQVYYNKLKELNSPIAKLEQIISNYFLETGKKIKIKGDGEIEVYLPTSKQSSIFKLSSGEKQIIIMIAHLIFSENFKYPGIFIIDEPEVSLHLSWQEIFVESIVEASSQTQFILATHSPSIIGKIENEVYCHDLSPKL